MNDYVLGQPQPPRISLGARFAVFGLVIVIVVGLLTTRLFYLQVVQGGYYAGLAEENRQQTQPIRSARGLIYDRAGRPLAINIPSYVVRIRPADLPFGQRDAVVERLSSLLDVPATDIIEALDRYASLRFELVRIASDVPSDVARIIVEESRELPGVEVDVEERRQYEYGALVSHVLGYTGAVTAEDLVELEEAGYLNDDQIGKTGVEATFEEELRGLYGSEQVERDASGRVVRTVQIVDDPRGRVIARADARRRDPAGGGGGAPLGDRRRRPAARRGHRHEPADRRDSGPGIAAQLRQQPLCARHLEHRLPGARRGPESAAGQLRAQRAVPARLDVQAGHGRRRARGRADQPIDRARDGPVPRDRHIQVLGMESTRLRAAQHVRWLRPLERHVLLPARRRPGHRSPRPLGDPSSVSASARASTCRPRRAASSRPTNGSRASSARTIFPGEVYQAGIGQGYDTATPLQVLNSYCALANGGSLLKPQIVRRVLAPDGAWSAASSPSSSASWASSPEMLRTMRLAAREVVTSGHTYNLVDLPLVVAGKTGTAEFGLRDSQGACPSTRGSRRSCRSSATGQPGDPAQTDSELAIVAFAYDSNTKGNAATEIVKYFLQDHYDLGVDLTRPDLLQRGNFYGGH